MTWRAPSPLVANAGADAGTVATVTQGPTGGVLSWSQAES